MSEQYIFIGNKKLGETSNANELSLTSSESLRFFKLRVERTETKHEFIGSMNRAQSAKELSKSLKVLEIHALSAKGAKKHVYCYEQPHTKRTRGEVLLKAYTLNLKKELFYLCMKIYNKSYLKYLTFRLTIIIAIIRRLK